MLVMLDMLDFGSFPFPEKMTMLNANYGKLHVCGPPGFKAVVIFTYLSHYLFDDILFY